MIMLTNLTGYISLNQSKNGIGLNWINQISICLRIWKILECSNGFRRHGLSSVVSTHIVLYCRMFHALLQNVPRYVFDRRKLPVDRNRVRSIASSGSTTFSSNRQ